MPKQLGFRCTCGNAIFASTTYFGEHVKCGACGQTMEIPFGFYRNQTMALLYPWLMLVFGIVMGILYVQFPKVLGSPETGVWWRLPLWLMVLLMFGCYFFTRMIMDPLYQALTGKNFLENRGHAQAIGLDEIALFTPLAVFSSLACTYWMTSMMPESDPLGWFRGPWWFWFIGTGISVSLAAALAWLRIKFGPRKMLRV